MVQCPACSTEIDADFGMKTCPNCSAVFMVNFDGTVADPSVAQAEAEIAASEEEAPVEEADNSEPEYFTAPDSGEGDADAAEEPAFEAPQGEGDYFPVHEETEEDSVIAAGDTSGEPVEYTEDFLDSLNEPAPSPVDDKKDPLGVTRFDRSEASQALDGPYYYDVTVSGLDTAQLKQAVINTLSDKRLGWTADDIKKMIRLGELRLMNLNPVKAVLTVIKLQSFDIDVSWEQRLFTEDAAADQPKET